MTRQPYKIDTDFGESLHQLLSVEAEATGQKRSELVRELVRDALLARGQMQDLVRNAVIQLARAMEPDDRNDPADDPREAVALGHLAGLLGSASAAQGVADALALLSTDRDRS